MQGDSVVRHPGNQRARNDKVFTGLYAAWNCAQFARNRRDVLQQHPEYNQCWFSQQAEWNLYSNPNPNPNPNPNSNPSPSPNPSPNHLGHRARLSNRHTAR